MSGNATKVYSRSGYAPLVNVTITNFRTYARKLGSDFGQLDWRYFLIQMLYLVEYADYDSQEALGLGNTINTSSVASGECDTLGMKSGSVINDGKHSVIYRGVEDIFGNIYQYVDGINIKNHQTYINYNPNTYQVDTFDGDYRVLGYVNAKEDGYVKQLGYDDTNPLVSIPIATVVEGNSYTTDIYRQSSGNVIPYVGGVWRGADGRGLWSLDNYYKSSYTSTGIGARILRYV